MEPETALTADSGLTLNFIEFAKSLDSSASWRNHYLTSESYPLHESSKTIYLGSLGLFKKSHQFRWKHRSNLV
jgi:hypothetical protein